ncbi:sugar ABC transporter substrate-binding protein [Spirochaetia bacterium]|nr:sugar ABC transporter substrate-binding protein [Spirochaetia bacterium]
MPAAMADGIVKIAIVRNLAVSDHTRQFLEGCIAEGRSLGFTVDTFIIEDDNSRCRELIGKITAADYDGLIISHGDAGFPYDSLKRAAEKGIKIVTFDALPFVDGDSGSGIINGITSTAQDDARLAEITLEEIISLAGKERPARVIRVWFGPGIPPLDQRQTVYDRFVSQGKIQELALVSPRGFAFSRNGTRETLAAVLPLFPEGTVDAIWAPYDEFARGCVDALKEAGRRDIKIVSIDISNDDIRMMLDNAGIWVAAAAVDPGLIGIVDMRILAARLAGEATPDAYTFGARIVRTASLNNSVTMANIGLTESDWVREQGLFDNYQWMTELKTAGKKHLRLSPFADSDPQIAGNGVMRNAP